MGKSMSATPTPESMVWQGGANTLENRCPTTPPLKGGRGGGACITCLAWGGAMIWSQCPGLWGRGEPRSGVTLLRCATDDPNHCRKNKYSCRS